MKKLFKAAPRRGVAIATAVGLSFGGLVVPVSVAPAFAETSAATIELLEQKIEEAYKELSTPMDIGEVPGTVFGHYDGNKTFIVRGNGKIDKSKFLPRADTYLVDDWFKPNDRRVGFLSKIRTPYINMEGKPHNYGTTEVIGAQGKYLLKIERGVQFPDDSERLFSGAPVKIAIDSSIDTSNITNMSAMFLGTTAANPDVSKWDTSNVTNMSHVFNYALAANPDVSNWDTSNVTALNHIFYNTKVANPDVSKWDTSKVTTLEEAFGSSDAANPDVSQWNTSNVTTLGAIFHGAKAANPDTSNWNTDKVGVFYHAFTGSAVSDIDVRTWTGAGATQETGVVFGNLDAEKFERFLFTHDTGFAKAYPVVNNFSLNADTKLVLNKITNAEQYAEDRSAGTEKIGEFTGRALTKELTDKLESGASYELVKAGNGRRAEITASDVTVSQGRTVYSDELIRLANVRARDKDGTPLKVEVETSNVDTSNPGTYTATFVAKDSTGRERDAQSTVTVIANDTLVSPEPEVPTTTATTTPSSEAPTPAAGTPTASAPTPEAGAPTAGTPSAGTPSTSAPSPAPGTPTVVAPTPAPGTPSAGTPTTGTPGGDNKPATTPAAPAKPTAPTKDNKSSQNASPLRIVGAILASLLGVGVLGGLFSVLSGALKLPGGAAIPGLDQLGEVFKQLGNR